MIKSFFLLLFIVSSFAEQPVNQRCPVGNSDSNLQRCYHMDYNEDPIRDSSQNNNTGALEGADFTSSGKFGGCYDFIDANNDYINCGIGSVITDNLTVVAWIYPHSFAGNDPGIVSRYGEGGCAWFFSCRDEPDNNLQLYVYDSGGVISSLVSDTKLTANQWHFVVFTIEGTALTIYLNGLEDGSGTSTNGGIRAEVSSEFRIGIWNIIGGDRDFDGYIDEVAAYDRVWPPEEVKAYYYKKARNYD